MDVSGLLEFAEPDLEFPVADEFDILPADDFLAVVGHQFPVTRADVDDLGAVETDGLGDHSAPTFFEVAFDDFEIGAGRAGADHQRVGALQAVDSRCEGAHDALKK